MLQELLKLCNLIAAYRALALDEHALNTRRDPYSYFNKRMRELDQQAQALDIPGVKPYQGEYNDERN